MQKQFSLGERRVDYDWRTSTAVTACAAGVDRGGKLDWWLLSILNVSSASLKAIRAVTGSQWSSTNTRVMCTVRVYSYVSFAFTMIHVAFGNKLCCKYPTPVCLNTAYYRISPQRIPPIMLRLAKLSARQGTHFGGYFALYVTVLRGCSIMKKIVIEN